MRDSWGISGTGEIPPTQSGRVAHRTPPGKRATWSGNQPLPKASLLFGKNILQEEHRIHNYSPISYENHINSYKTLLIIHHKEKRCTNRAYTLKIKNSDYYQFV